MATQLKTDFQPTFRPALQPTLRVVFDTTSATSAVIAAVDKMPAAAREATLEEITIASATEALIASAGQVLSPHIYRTFLSWGAAAAALAQECESDDESSRRLGQVNDTLQDLAGGHAITLEDRNFKAWIAMVEVGDCDCFGPAEVRDTVGGYLALVAEGVVRDLGQSPLCRRLDALARLVRDASPSRAEWSHPLAQVVIDAFETAQQMPVALPSADMFRHGEVARILDPNDRAPLVAWEDAHKAYQEAWRTYDALLAAGDYEDATHDRLYTTASEALDRFLLTPAPSHAAAAIRARVYEERECWEGTNADEIARAFAADACRLARLSIGAGADDALIDALAVCTKAHREAAALPADHTQVDEDAIWAREDVSVMTLLDTEATAAVGVVAKLRRAFVGITQDAWGEDALLDPSSERFQDGLRMADVYERMMWSAITDLARIAGVDLGASPASAAIRDQHRGWFETRNLLFKRINEDYEGDVSSKVADEQTSAACGLLNKFDNSIFEVKPTTVDGLISQLVLFAQLSVEGHEVSEATAAQLVASAIRLTDQGSLSGACPLPEKA